MNPKRKNLLEAFQDASNVPEEVELDPPPSEFLKERGRALDASFGDRFASLSLPGWLPWAAAIGVAFVVGIAIGRASAGAAGEVQARTEGGEVAPGADREPAPDPRAREGQAGERDSGAVAADGPAGLGEDALRDPKNRYTVIAATYGRTREDLAWSTHEQLAEHGLPVFRPVVSGDNILILVGAAPTTKELADTESKLRELTSWDGSKAFADAYAVRIDRYIEQREN